MDADLKSLSIEKHLGFLIEKPVFAVNVKYKHMLGIIKRGEYED